MLIRPILRAASTSATSSTSSAAISAYMLLSRPPTVLRSPTPFESAYHAYNSKLQQALSSPFPRDLYFKKGSAAETKFLEEEQARKTAAAARGTVEDSKTSSSEQDEQAARVDESSSSDILYQTVSRRTKADEEGRTDTLERVLDRHLFLVVKGGDMGNSWTLPYTKVDKMGTAILHKVAPHAVHSILGEELDIWMVTNLPVGVIPSHIDGSERGYIMRGHILSGHPTPSTKGVEFAWLTREEIQDRIDEKQWEGIQDLLSA
jgi:large subunit ribosomal protein L46